MNNDKTRTGLALSGKCLENAWTLDYKDLRPGYIGQSIPAMTGYTIEELQALTMKDLLVPPSYELAAAVLKEHASAGEKGPVSLDVDIVRKDGRTLRVDVDVAVERDSSGNPVRFIWFAGRRKAADETWKVIEFRGLVSSISMNFINIHPMKLGKGVYDSLKRIAEFFGADRGYISTFYTDTNLNIKREWRDGDITSAHETAVTVLKHSCPWALENLKKNAAVTIDTLSDLPPEAENEKRLFTDLKVKSAVVLPMLSSGELTGLLVFETLREERSWSADDVSSLMVFCAIFTDIIERAQAEKELLDIFFSRLSEREVELLKYLACGLEWPEDKRFIGKKMDVLPGTLDKFMTRVKGKMKLDDTGTVIKIARLYLADHIFNA